MQDSGIGLTYRKTVKIFVGELIHWGIENKHIRFPFVGGVNASIYFVILLGLYLCDGELLSLGRN